jgi:Flp pilus assembly CpaF family ATPase
MRVWYHSVNQSRRVAVDVDAAEVTVGRDSSNDVVLPSRLVSRQHAIVRLVDGRFVLQNVGLNSCQVGEMEVAGTASAEFEPGTLVRIWPFSLTFETDKDSRVTRVELETHLREVVAELELKIHNRLLERLDLHELDSRRANDPESILLLENHIEDVCRELHLFAIDNEALLEELTGLVVRDHLVNQLILEQGREELADQTVLTANEFDTPAALVTEREAELHGLLRLLRAKIDLATCTDVSEQIRRVETRFPECFALARPHLHEELRKYLVLRMLKKDLKDTILGFGPLQDLLRAPSVTEIMVVGRDQIYVEQAGVIENSGRRFISDKVTESIIERIVASVGRRIDKSQPLVDARLPDGSRVNAIIPPLAVKGPTLTIRKFSGGRLQVEDLIDMQCISRAAATFLRACVIDRRNIVVSGGTSTGKTTLLNILSGFIPFKERIVTIEDTMELQLRQEHVVSLETKQANAEGAGAYTIRDLVHNALRMRPDRIVVGECRGPEALDMIQAMNTGHDGSLTSIHANCAGEVITRLEVLVLLAADLPVSSIHRQLVSAIDLIVHVTRLTGGRRVVTQISEVTRIDPDTNQIVVLDIFNCRNGKSLQPTGYLPTFVEGLVNSRLLEAEFLYCREPNAETRGVMAQSRGADRRDAV